MKSNITIVTGLWDMGRGDLPGWANRDFQHYKDRFFEMLETDAQMCIFIPQDLEEDVRRIRGEKPTRIFIKNLEDFETWNPFFNKIQEIRNNPQWRNFTGWLVDSPQAALKYYNPMMFTKMFMLNDSAIMDPFGSDYFFWIDGGLTNTVGKNYFVDEKVLDNLDNYVIKHENKFVQISYPYTSNDEIHGFERRAMARHCGVDFVNYVCRGGFFGGHKDRIHEVNMLYYNIMESTLNENLMGADECLFTILAHKYPIVSHRFEIDGNGLVWPFFEELKKYNDDSVKHDTSFSNPDNVGLYVITFNSPKQFETLITSMLQYDDNFINRPRKILLDNSGDLSTTQRYIELCRQYNFEHVKKDNLGICGGRQWIAEDAEQRGFDFYFFFEDDMFFYPKQGDVCKNGFNRYVKDLYKHSISIAQNENLDFLKLNFTEFYGDNSTQWSWYNVPQKVRDEVWPEKNQLPERGYDPNAPRTEFKHIKSYNGIPYALGEVYYCNWPQVVTKKGNTKMFLDTKWGHPYEQTWMSHMFQESRKGNLSTGILLMTPTEHDRFDFYDGSLRKES
jgi:hypothetical protein